MHLQPPPDIPRLLREAGFADATEVVHRVTRPGRITHCRATVALS